MDHMKRFLIIGDREKYGHMEDFVVLWVGNAEDQANAVQQFREIIKDEFHDIFKVIEIAGESEIPAYSGF
jgi:hypothetical protein